MGCKATIYNSVSVTVKNQNTGNHCINVNQLLNGKSFDFIIDKNHYILTPRQVMDYIDNNRCKVFKHIDAFDEETGKYRHYCFGFYLIDDNFIMENAI